MRDTQLISIRDSELVSAYYAELHKLGDNARFISKRTIIQNILTNSAPRFYCSFEEASRICSLIIRGKKASRKGVKKSMYNDLTQIVKNKLQENRPVTMRLAILQALQSPAPEWYIGIDSALRIINKSFKKEGI